MRPPREVAHSWMVTPCANGWHHENCDRLTAAIEARDREVVNASAEAIETLPVVGVETVPYLAGLKAARRAVLALAHPPGGTK